MSDKVNACSVDSGLKSDARRFSTPEPTDSFLRSQYHKNEKRLLKGCKRDHDDVEKGLERERWFTADWNRLTKNKIWAKEEGPPVVLYEGSVADYKGGESVVWPRGRDLNELSLYGQIWDYFRFMWEHTKPYKAVAVMLVMSLSKPFQTALLSYIASEIQQDPKSVPLWLYLTPFYVAIFERFCYWWYEMWVPLNSQRVQLRSVMLTQRVRLPDDHPLAFKWSEGRFTGFLKDVDEVVNGIWNSCLKLIDKLVDILYILILCFVNLALSTEEKIDGSDYAVYVAVFLGLGILTMFLPFLWFRLYTQKLQECENMVRDGQALYMSATSHSIRMESLLANASDDNESVDLENPSSRSMNTYQESESVARKAFRLFGLTTFRNFFFQLAMTTNYSLVTKVLGPLVSYGLLTGEGFGQGFNLASTLIVLLSLRDLTQLSTQLLALLTTMSRGCNVLIDVAELLNADMDEKIDIEKEL